MDECWEELRRAGEAMAKGHLAPSLAVRVVAPYFDPSQSAEVQAVHVFLDGLRGNIASDPGWLDVPDVDDSLPGWLDDQDDRLPELPRRQELAGCRTLLPEAAEE
jgi:hypothetical protein